MSSRSSRVNDRCGLAVKRDKRTRHTVVRGLAVNTANGRSQSRSRGIRQTVVRGPQHDKRLFASCGQHDKRSFAPVSAINGRSRSRHDKRSFAVNARSRGQRDNVCGLAVNATNSRSRSRQRGKRSRSIFVRGLTGNAFVSRKVTNGRSSCRVSHVTKPESI